MPERARCRIDGPRRCPDTYKRLLLLSFLPVLPLLGQAQREPGFPQGSGPLTIRIVDAAEVPEQTLKRASEAARAELRQAGIETEWLPACRVTNPRVLETDADCISAIRGQTAALVIRILGQKMISPNIASGVLGTINRENGLVYVFYSRIENSKIADIPHRSALLAAVMVHETGHLLGLAHSLAGIMRAEFRAVDVHEALLSRLAFSPDEADQLRKSALIWTSTRIAVNETASSRN